ncbi:hypothetical protein [Pseudofrankia sp. DC12]|uniref:hypothetical protein n=1 Tax=Pseudofrankia sp. DC12 TaxID=683315 RepID=UPI0005F87B47|nr:hypothetical protein [Pseudofrankia sp. DC12]
MGRKGNRLLLVFGAVVLAGVMALGLGLTGSSNTGAHATDPSDDGNFNTYALVNDSKARVIVYLCLDTPCTQINTRSAWIPMAPGESITRNEYWNPGVGYGFKIATSPRGRRCLTINADTKAPKTVTIPLSTAKSCPTAAP